MFLRKGYIHNITDEPELRKDFEEFYRRMRIKWYFRNDISHPFSEKPAFIPRSKWKSPKSHLSLKVFLIQIEKDIVNWLSTLFITLPVPRRNDML